VVAAAFALDPAWSFLFGDDYEALAPHFARVLFDDRVGSGDVWVTGDVSAVAMWDPPVTMALDRGDSGARWRAYRTLVGEPAWGRLRVYEEAVDRARPSTPYWYLGVLATAPDRQGRGRATAVMAAVLDRADSEGLDCCLETSTVANREFYRRRRFTEVTELDMSPGPPTWWLRRPPLSEP
jgi:GNAT superfamily N-acetyltransferase